MSHWVWETPGYQLLSRLGSRLEQLTLRNSSKKKKKLIPRSVQEGKLIVTKLIMKTKSKCTWGETLGGVAGNSIARRAKEHAAC